MRKKHRKFRKTPHELTDLTSVSNKENSFSNTVCNKNQALNFRANGTESINCSYQLKNKKPRGSESRRNKKNKEEQLQNSYLSVKSPNVDWYEKNTLLTFPLCKKSSVAFFIPLKDPFYRSSENSHFKHMIDWSNLWFYESTSFSIVSRYQFERTKEHEKTMTPLLRQYRSSSESSANSEDSFISFLDSNDDDIVTFSATIIHRNIDSTAQSFLKNETIVRNQHCCTTKNPSKQIKKVCFKNNSELVNIHYIIAWDFAYRAARISPWETAARDANRFKQKIQSLELILSPVLYTDHRERIWKSRLFTESAHDTENR